MQLKLVHRRIPYKGKVFNVILDDVVYESGRLSIREIAEHPGGAVALPVFPDGRILMIRQHRYPFDAYLWELPAGRLEPQEDPLLCAQRELREETGYQASEWKKLLSICTSPGFCSEELHIYLATGLTLSPDGRALEEGEQTMTVEIIPFGEALAMIDRNEIRDAKTICGILQGRRIMGG